jgi:hypothetical protein
MNVIYYNMRNACLVPAFLLLVGQASLLNAQTVLIDFGSASPCYAANPNGCGSYRGADQIGADSNGNYWNSVQPGLFYPLDPTISGQPAKPGLVDIQNNFTSLALGWDTPVGSDSYNGPVGGATTDGGFTSSSQGAQKQAWMSNQAQLVIIDSAALGILGGSVNAAFDYADSPGSGTAGTGNNTRFEIQGLDPAKKYALTFYGSHLFSTDATTVYTVYSDNTFTTPVASTTLNVQDPVDFTKYNANTVATISNLSPQANNILYVNFIGSGGHEGYLNELEIAASTPAGTIGDYNSDGKVDAADYTVWRDHLGQTFTLPNRDPANTGVISAADYTSWKSHFGLPGSGAGASSAVPEPSSVVLSVIASLALAFYSKRRRS